MNVVRLVLLEVLGLLAHLGLQVLLVQLANKETEEKQLSNKEEVRKKPLFTSILKTTVFDLLIGRRLGQRIIVLFFPRVLKVPLALLALQEQGAYL